MGAWKTPTLNATTLAFAAALAVGGWAQPAQAWGHGRDNGGEIAQQAVQAPPAEPDAATSLLRIGKLYSFGGGNDTRHGFGLDLRYRLYPGSSPLHIGLFSQGQYELGEAFRFAGGVTAGFGMLTLEVGAAHRTAASGFAATTGIHLAKALDLGPVTVGARVTLPVHTQIPQNVAVEPGRQGTEIAFFLRGGFDITLDGPRRRAASCHGGGHGRR